MPYHTRAEEDISLPVMLILTLTCVSAWPGTAASDGLSPRQSGQHTRQHKVVKAVLQQTGKPAASPCLLGLPMPSARAFPCPADYA